MTWVRGLCSVYTLNLPPFGTWRKWWMSGLTTNNYLSNAEYFCWSGSKFLEKNQMGGMWSSRPAAIEVWPPRAPAEGWARHVLLYEFGWSKDLATICTVRPMSRMHLTSLQKCNRAWWQMLFHPTALTSEFSNPLTFGQIHLPCALCAFPGWNMTQKNHFLLLHWSNPPYPPMQYFILIGWRKILSALPQNWTDI